MHIIIAFLGSVISLLWVLHRLAEMGIDLGGLNPFLWRRRRKWTMQYQANPIFQITDPMESTALLLTAVAKADGDMSVEEKAALLDVFRSEFELSARDSAALLAASSHALGKGDEVRDQLDKVLAPSLDTFQANQIGTACELMERMAVVGGSASGPQRELVENATSLLKEQLLPKGKWE